MMCDNQERAPWQRQLSTGSSSNEVKNKADIKSDERLGSRHSLPKQKSKPQKIQILGVNSLLSTPGSLFTD